MNREKMCLIDMDGTLFDYEGKLREDLAKLAAPNDPEINDLHDESLAWLRNRITLVTSQPGWWRHLPLLKSGELLLSAAREIGFSCKILTKGPRKKTLAWAEKVECINDRWPDLDIDIVGKDKTGTYGRVLIDDFPDYMSGWLKHRPRGLGIMPKCSYNLDFNHPNVILYDESNLEQVLHAMKAAFQRPTGEHWRDYL